MVVRAMPARHCASCAASALARAAPIAPVGSRTRPALYMDSACVAAEAPCVRRPGVKRRKGDGNGGGDGAGAGGAGGLVVEVEVIEELQTFCHISWIEGVGRADEGVGTWKCVRGLGPRRARGRMRADGRIDGS
eukprot:481720-Pleurochrysis_carterae.AAC.1